MPFAASHSVALDTPAAIQEVCEEVRARLHGQPPDVAFLFVSHAHAAQFDSIAAMLRERLGVRHLLGCTGETVVGGHLEIETGAALSLWCAVLPHSELISFRVEFERTPDGLLCLGFPEISTEGPPVTGVLFLGEPFTCPIETFIQRVEEELPGVPLIGGMASGAGSPGENVLFLQDERIATGGVGLVIRGGSPIRTIVSQGCRPIGSTLLVTKAQQNVILELSGKPALERLKEVFGSLSEEDRLLVQQGLHLGLVMDEYQETFSRGDFLIANVIGADTELGAIAIGHLARVGQTVQFHVRDAVTADEDLRQLLAEMPQRYSTAPQAALLFSCNGRGTRMFPRPNHDAGVIQELCGPLPLAGFFAQGELGPVSGRNHVHGFTASVALFSE